MHEPTAKPRVMFVDDDPMLLASTKRQLMFKVGNVELLFCTSGEEALRILDEGPVDVVFSDVRMPGMDGPALLSRIAELSPRTIRYAWTGQTEGSQQDRIQKVAHQVFTKPCNTETLQQIIQSGLSCAEQNL